MGELIVLPTKVADALTRPFQDGPFWYAAQVCFLISNQNGICVEYLI